MQHRNVNAAIREFRLCHQRGDPEALVKFVRLFEPSIQRVVKRVIRSRTASSTLERHVLSEVEHLSRNGSHADSRDKETRVSLIVNRICESLILWPNVERHQEQGRTDTVRLLETVTVN